MSDKVIFVMGDGNSENDYGHWVGIYVNGELVHQGKWPVPFPVLQKILEADVHQVSINVPDGEKFAGGQGLPEFYENIGNTQGVTSVGYLPFTAKEEKRATEAVSAKARIINNLREIITDPRSTPLQVRSAEQELARIESLED